MHFAECYSEDPLGLYHSLDSCSHWSKWRQTKLLITQLSHQCFHIYLGWTSELWSDQCLWRSTSPDLGETGSNFPWKLQECTCVHGHRHNRHIFLRGQSHFSWFFFRRKMPFPGRKFRFGRPKTNFRHFQKWKKKKGPHLFFITFLLPYPIFHLPFYHFPSFLLNFHPFPFFLSLFFPDTSAKISRSEVSGGGGALPLPVTPLLVWS